MSNAGDFLNHSCPSTNDKENSMNWQLIIAGAFALFTTLGHFTIGKKEFLMPTLNADFDRIAKKVIHCVFHYVSTFLILSTVLLMAVGFGILNPEQSKFAVYFIALNYTIFAIWQIGLALLSGIPNGIFKLFQWIFFILISIFAFMGACGL